MTVPVDVSIPFKLAKQNVISEFDAATSRACLAARRQHLGRRAPPGSI